MSLVRFQINFDNPSATYFCGQHVTGNVVVELLKEKKFRAIELKFLGEAKVQWSETSGETTVVYTNREMYMKNSIDIAGGSHGEIILRPGKHSYPFMLIMPLGIPSSFENKHGHVRYTAKAVIHRPGRFDHTCKSAFTVLSPLDLNNEPHIMKPVQTRTEKKLFFGISGSPITLEVLLPFSGYVPGQKCHADFKLNNPTTNGVSLKAYIIQFVTLKAKCGRKKVERIVICKENVGGVPSKGSMSSSVGFQIPALPNSYLNYCNFIDISYVFDIKGSITGIHRDFSASTPIVIGSIPLRTQFNHLTQRESQNPLPKVDKLEVLPLKEAESLSTSSATSTNSNPFFSYPDMPPPSYEECHAGTNDIRNEEDSEYIRGETTFAPRYPVYSFKENDS